MRILMKMTTMTTLAGLMSVSLVFGAELENSFGDRSVVIAADTVQDENCDVASCSARAYFDALKRLDQLVDVTCKQRRFDRYVVLKTGPHPEAENAKTLQMTALCK